MLEGEVIGLLPGRRGEVGADDILGAGGNALEDETVLAEGHVGVGGVEVDAVVLKGPVLASLVLAGRVAEGSVTPKLRFGGGAGGGADVEARRLERGHFGCLRGDLGGHDAAGAEDDLIGLCRGCGWRRFPVAGHRRGKGGSGQGEKNE